MAQHERIFVFDFDQHRSIEQQAHYMPFSFLMVPGDNALSKKPQPFERNLSLLVFLTALVAAGFTPGMGASLPVLSRCDC